MIASKDVNDRADKIVAQAHAELTAIVREHYASHGAELSPYELNVNAGMMMIQGLISALCLTDAGPSGAVDALGSGFGAAIGQLPSEQDRVYACRDFTNHMTRAVQRVKGLLAAEQGEATDLAARAAQGRA